MRLSRLTSEEFSPRNEAGVFFVVVAAAEGVELLAELEVLLDDSGSRSSSNDNPLLFRLLLTALLLLLRLVIISNSSRSEAGEVIAPTGDGRCAGNAKAPSAIGAQGSCLAGFELGGCQGSAVGTGVVRLGCHASLALGADVFSHGSTFPLVPATGAVAPAPVPFWSQPSTDEPDVTEGDCVRAGAQASSPTPGAATGGLAVGGGSAEALFSQGSTTGGEDVRDHGSVVCGLDPPATGSPHGSVLVDGPGCCDGLEILAAPNEMSSKSTRALSAGFVSCLKSCSL